jgi:hypothetical protein
MYTAMIIRKVKSQFRNSFQDQHLFPAGYCTPPANVHWA